MTRFVALPAWQLLAAGLAACRPSPTGQSETASTPAAAGLAQAGATVSPDTAFATQLSMAQATIASLDVPGAADTGQATSDGRPFRGYCMPSSPDWDPQPEDWLVGDIVPAGPDWLIERARVREGESGVFDVVDSQMVAINQIDVVDVATKRPVLCKRVGTGPAVVVDGELVRFTCSDTGDLVLVGEVVPAGRDWTIEIARITRDASGAYSATEKRSVPINSLAVASEGTPVATP